MRPALALVLAAFLAAAPQLAHADAQPWSVGVSEANKAKAQVSLEAGNALFLDKKYGEAIEKYKTAIAAWDHPAIRFNLVRCLIQLSKPVDAYDNLKLALKYGAAPLEDTVYTEALAYEKLLANQIASISVSCTQSGVKLTLDGQALAMCPATEQRRVEPGTHQVVGTKDGFLTRTFETVIVGGKEEAVAVSLDPMTKAARIEHRWPQWMPWVVFGGGFAVAGMGGLVQLSANSQADSFDRAVAQRCPNTPCSDAELGDDADLRDKAKTRATIAASVMVLGGATVITGAVLLYMNRGRTVYPDSVERLTPSVSPVPGGATLSVSGQF